VIPARHLIDWAICLVSNMVMDLRGEHFTNSGTYILLTPGNFYDEGGFKYKGDKEKYYVGEIPDGFILNEGDLIVAMTEQMDGLLGSSAIVPAGNKYLHNQRLGLIVDIKNDLLDKKFLYYLFNTAVVRNQIKASASGTKVRHTSPSRIYEVRVKLPPLPLQRKIADVLSAYDDLIEVNTRRIRILEQMAGSVYREWFGNVDAKSLPEGWETKKLGDVVELAYGKGLKADQRIDGPYPVYGSAGVVGYHNEFLVRGPGIIVGRKGNVGSVFWSNKDFYPIDTTYFVRTDISLFYVFFNL
jgi:type I restriction enzyme S subunit